MKDERGGSGRALRARGAPPRRDPRGARLLRHRDLDQGAHRAALTVEANRQLAAALRLPAPPRRHARGQPRPRHRQDVGGLRAAAHRGHRRHAPRLHHGRQPRRGEGRPPAPPAPGPAHSRPSTSTRAPPAAARRSTSSGITKAVEEATKDLTYPCRVAVMGCIVNGPGEAAEADVSISAGRGFGFIYRGSRMIRKVPEADLVRGAARRDRRLDRRAPVLKAKDLHPVLVFGIRARRVPGVPARPLPPDVAGGISRNSRNSRDRWLLPRGVGAEEPPPCRDAIARTTRVPGGT